METDLIFHRGADLPCFAAFPLVETEAGRALLTGYYDGYAAIARRTGAGLMLEAPTWRANPEWGERLGFGAARLGRVNTAAIEMLAGLRERYAPGIADITVGGVVGPRDDGYRTDRLMGLDEAADYHRPQIDSFAAAGADLVTAYTLTGPAEAAGIVRACRSAGLPAAISFTVETDGRLADGRPLGVAIAEVDEIAPPDYYLLNCAHPDHVGRALAESADQRHRLAGMRYNASRKSHAELDEATDLDDGDPQELAEGHRELRPLLPNLSIVGGCCGTDARHVAALWEA
jgi:homocysteine S-methyltransferase